MAAAAEPMEIDAPHHAQHGTRGDEAHGEDATFGVNNRSTGCWDAFLWFLESDLKPTFAPSKTAIYVLITFY